MLLSKYSGIIAEWSKWKNVIDRAIDDTIADIPEAEAIEVTRYITSGGKRFRGFLVILIAESLGTKPERALPAAVAVELVHAASLALDDIIDNDTMRRGKTAAWVEYGIGKTVMVSNLIIPFAQRIVLENYGYEAVERTIQAWLDVSRGEVMDAFLDPKNTSPEKYYEIARRKTGALFRLACELGVLASPNKITNTVLEKMAKYGENLGIIYQYADDIIDLKKVEDGEIELSMLSPSTILFYKIAGTASNAIRQLARMVKNTSNIITELELPSKIKEILATIPVFMAEAMLMEKNLVLEE